jgi:hypothetical protein
MSTPFNTPPGTTWAQLDPPTCNHHYADGTLALERLSGSGFWCHVCDAVLDEDEASNEADVDLRRLEDR